jgi:hypothetical protein
MWAYDNKALYGQSPMDVLDKERTMENQHRVDEAAYEWAFRAWVTDREREAESAHLATSLLYDLLRHERLTESERAQARQHLAVCAACEQALQAMRKVIAGCVVYTEQVPLAAAGVEPDQQRLSLTHTAGDKIKIMETPHGEVTLLWLDVEPPYLTEFENKYIHVFDAHHQPLCRGQIVAGTVAWRLPGKPAHPLQLIVEPDAS